MDLKTYISRRLFRYAGRLGTSLLKIALAIVMYCLGSLMLHHAMPALMFVILYLAVCCIWQIHREINLFRDAQAHAKHVAVP